MRRRVVATSFAFLLLAGAFVASRGEAAPEGWRVSLTIDSATAQPAKQFEAFDTASLNLYDFDGDGQLEIVSNNDNNRAYVLDSRSGAVLAELPTRHPWGEEWPVRDLNPISIGFLYGDGVPCMIVPSNAAHLTAWCFDAANSTRAHFVFNEKWDVQMDARKFEPDFQEKHPWLYYESNGTIKNAGEAGADGQAFLATVDDPSCQWVFGETDGLPGQFAFDCHGNYKWSVSWFDGNAGATVIDLHADGSKDACFASDGGEVACFDAKTGAYRWVFRAREHGAFPASIPTIPTWADVYGTGKLYAMFGARNAVKDAENPNWINESHAVWYQLDPNGNLVWSASYDWMNPLAYTHPAVVDVNGDGVLDMVAIDWNTVGHNPGNWDITNRPSNLFALNGKDGSVLWHRSVAVFWSNKDVIVADVDEDGTLEIIAPTANGPEDGLGVYDLATGTPESWFGVPWQLSRSAVAGDLWGDGKMQLVIPIARAIVDTPNYRSLDVGYREGALLIVETGAKFFAPASANSLNSELQDLIAPKPAGLGGLPPPVVTAPVPTEPVVTAPLPTEPVVTAPAPTEPVATTLPPVVSTPTVTTPAVTTPAPSTTTTTPAPNVLPSETSTLVVPEENAARVPGPSFALVIATAAIAAGVLCNRHRRT